MFPWFLCMSLVFFALLIFCHVVLPPIYFRVLHNKPSWKLALVFVNLFVFVLLCAIIIVMTYQLAQAATLLSYT